MEAIMTTNLQNEFPELVKINQGKVRDTYEYGNDLIIVTTDRVSAFDQVLDTPIPQKGMILNELSKFWFDYFREIRSHYIGSVPETFFKYNDRSMLVKKAEPIPAEFIVRGHITGYSWKDYCEKGKVCGIKLPEGLVEHQKLENPIFTPSTKETEGKHDRNISFDELVELPFRGSKIGFSLANDICDLALYIYRRAYTYASQRGIIIADTKFEFGMIGHGLLLIDEVLTPDSSRFWDASAFQPGVTPNSFDKQIIRNYLLQFPKDQRPTILPQEIVNLTTNKYIEIYHTFCNE